MNDRDRPRKQEGASLVHWLIALTVLLGFGVLAIDMNNLYLSKRQLQNAADAGALEGARLLYNPDGTINLGQSETSAVAGATLSAQANNCQGEPAEVLSVNRGHWQFMTSHVDGNGIERGGVFSANGATIPTDLIDVDGNFRSFQDLNQDPNEINALEVTTARQLTPVQAIFGPFLGIENYTIQSRAVAYLGFAGTILPGEMDAPIAICQHRLRNEDGDWSCSIGRFISSSVADEQTAGWTDFGQPESCGGGANTSTIREMFSCGEGRNPQLQLGRETNVIGGEVQTVFDDLYNCWRNEADTDNDGEPDSTWSVTLPIIECNDSNPGPCNRLIGAVTMDILWMVRSVNVNRIDEVAPREMGEWINDNADGAVRWDSFVDYYQIRSGPGGELALWADPPGDNGYRSNTIYFSPSCSPQTPVGGSGGANFGIRARIPVLVH
ncbi:MAG: Tad domain-containing protein [Candidatus Thiodiazotropha sp. (ex Dulcina madagascariensis)]|nr:Tad domain-containing protein [Candidatus Thiodiazotropha sp. (ex Dulcina madagascariensis)]MCU7925065.1 Tad domain-containing protein [Candidatus Thiodiazotropha sp. (ex Dulcina madagascariensis)]